MLLSCSFKYMFLKKKIKSLYLANIIIGTHHEALGGEHICVNLSGSREKFSAAERL